MRGDLHRALALLEALASPIHTLSNKFVSSFVEPAPDRAPLYLPPLEKGTRESNFKDLLNERPTETREAGTEVQNGQIVSNNPNGLRASNSP